jgi:hypothetical protein
MAEIVTITGPLTHIETAVARQVSGIRVLLKTHPDITHTYVPQIADETATVDARDPRPIWIATLLIERREMTTTAHATAMVEMATVSDADLPLNHHL